MPRPKRKLASKLGVKQVPRTLRERFGVPPFSVLDANQPAWQRQRWMWLTLFGIKEEIGQGYIEDSEGLAQLSRRNWDKCRLMINGKNPFMEILHLSFN